MLTNKTFDTTACENCSAIYNQLNDIYFAMEIKNKNTICGDTVALVSATFDSCWSLVKKCSLIDGF